MYISVNTHVSMLVKIGVNIQKIMLVNIGVNTPVNMHSNLYVKGGSLNYVCECDPNIFVN